MGSGNSCMGSHPSGSRSQLSRSGTAMSKRSKLSFLICGASSGSHTHTPFQVENHLTKSTARPLEKKVPLNSVSLKPMEQPSSNCTSETGFSSSSPDSGASSEGIHGTVVKSSAEFGLINLETCSSGKCLSEDDGLLLHQASAHSTPVEFHRESSETSGITFKEQSSLESVDRPSSSVAQEPANLCLVEESILDAAKGFHSSDSDSGSASGSASVVPDSPENCQLLQDDSAERVTSSALGSIVSATEQDSRNRSRLHVDMVSISSDTLFRGISDVSNHEARSSRGMFWDTFSRRSFRQHSDSPTIVFATSHADGLRSHDRWLLDFSDLHYDGFGHDFRHPRYGGHHRRERRRWSRYESSERFHSDLDDEDRHMSFCASGLHPNGRCTCGTFFSAEEPSIHASIFQILMLADALFEVLDEIHHHPVSDSPSVLSLPAPVDVVDSFPLKNHKKVEATENGAQCYICLSEYEEGETIRVLPCCHEYHMSCIDKWLKEIHGVCPICRGDVCEGIAEASA